jgi:hypothetical protein
MRKLRVAWAPPLVAFFCACGGTAAFVRLQPEQPSTVHVGEVAVIGVAAESHSAVGSAGTSLVLMKRKEERATIFYFYRAVAAGRQTIVLTPRDPGPAGCISCIAVHYFVAVDR